MTSGAERSRIGDAILDELSGVNLEEVPGRRIVASWELRAAAALSAELRPTIDGGARIDSLSVSGPAADSFRFLVAAPPHACRILQSLERSAAAAGVANSWSQWTLRVAAVLSRVAEHSLVALAALEGALEPRCRIGGRLFVRLRGWRVAGRDPEARIETGVRFTVHAATAARSDMPLYEWAGSDPAQAPWIKHGPGRVASIVTAAATPRGSAEPAPRSEYHGPVVLLPRAAAWWVHEMAHAGLEEGTCAAQRRHGSGAIVESPGTAPWPFGFDVDDLGEPTGPLVLWGEAAAERPQRESGHARRASIRDQAVPSLGFTRLVAGDRPAIRLADLPSGTPVIGGVAASRYEPLSRTVVLDALFAGVTVGEPWRTAKGRTLIRCSIDEGWQGLTFAVSDRATIDQHDLDTLSGSCTRLGQRHHVQVGAPTIVLDPVRL